MNRGTTRIRLAIGVLALAAISAPALARNMTIDERVEYQRAIEQVYWSHRIWPATNATPKPPLSSVMPDTALRAKVEDYLEKSNALETYWHRPVTALQLQAELDRMARDTRDGATLRALFRALGDDPYVIAETLARQTLVDRLAHDWYARDARFHGDVKARAEAALASCANASCLSSTGGLYQQTRWTLRADEASSEPESSRDGTMTLDPVEWTDRIGKLARQFDATADALPTNRLSGLEETNDAFFVTVILAQKQGEITTASVVWPKRSFDSWWTNAAARVGCEIASSPASFAAPAVAFTTCTNDTWAAMRLQWTEPRYWHTAVWTGTEMIVWGGNIGVSPNLTGVNTGSRYNPSTDTWAEISTGANVPGPRYRHTAVWTGTEMIVWGGYGTGAYENTGGRYDPSTNAWTATSTLSAPTARGYHTAVWTGKEMIVWGGIVGGTYPNTGGRYNPSTDTWMDTSTAGGVPVGRFDHTAVWTGTEMIVWGGLTGALLNNPVGNGGRYDPSTDTWTATSVGANVPSGRYLHTALWTGAEMIVWGGGGISSSTMNTGGRYNPTLDKWTSTPTGAGVPSARMSHTAVWTGTTMIVWGGSDPSGNYTNTGARYDPAADTWTATSTGANAPTARDSQTSVWTGSEMIVWGGQNPLYALNTGARYDPSTNTWTTTAVGSGAPAASENDTAVWTGAEMIVWGGRDEFATDVNTGARYDPSTDVWTRTSTGVNVPSGREWHSAVWTGTEMIVWGGKNGASLNTGGRYNPSTDTWAASSMGANVPSARSIHTAVWTGTEMIVWGGVAGGTLSNTGGRYDPSTDSWTATSTGANVPPARSAHTAVWTGTGMIVWGGTGDTTGGRYNPGTDTWNATSTGANVPSPRVFHTAVWTGTEMIVWGGDDGSSNNQFNTGGRYNPATNAWTATSTGANVPSPREWHTAVWTGRAMIVWGGLAHFTPFNTGGRYDPSTNAWTATSIGANVPPKRYWHAAAWTGTEMAVWGGAPYTTQGGVYCACLNAALAFRDADGDGYGDPATSVTTCEGNLPPGYVTNGDDCNDANGSIHPGSVESCNGLDDDCDGTIDNVPPPAEVEAISVDGGNETTLSWTSLGDGEIYDVASSTITDLRSQGVATAICLAHEVQGTSYVDERGAPTESDAYIYLVRARSTCVSGSYGTDSNGQERLPTSPCP